MVQSRPRSRAPRSKPLAQRHSSRAKVRPRRLMQDAPPRLRDDGQILIAARRETQERQLQLPITKLARPARATRCRALRETATEKRSPKTGASLANSAEAVGRISCLGSGASCG